MNNQPFLLNQMLPAEVTADCITSNFERIRTILWEVASAHELDTDFKRVYIVLSVVEDMLEATEQLFTHFLRQLRINKVAL